MVFTYKPDMVLENVINIKSVQFSDGTVTKLFTVTDSDALDNNQSYTIMVEKIVLG